MRPAPPLVSVCLAVRNEQRHIAETLESIRAQTFTDFEVQIFDNASDDDTPAICARYLHDPRIALFRNAVDIGQVANFNRCFAAARGRYVCLMSGNDVLAPTYLEKLLEVAESDVGIGLVAAHLKIIQESSEPLAPRWWIAPTYFETDPADPVTAGTTVVANWRFHNYAFGLYRRSVLDRLQPLRYLFGADASFVFELALYAAIRVHPEPLFLLRKHERDQLQHQVGVFSEDATFDVAGASLFSHFDRLTPFIDLTWSYLETTSFARIPQSDKARLFEAIPRIQRSRWGRLIESETQRLAASARKTLATLRTRPDLVVHRAFAHRLATKLGRAAVVAPADDAVADLVRAFADLVRPEWPGGRPENS